MENTNNFFNNPNYNGYLAEYRGDFLNQINKIDYATGVILTPKLVALYINPNDLMRIRKDVPSITLIDFSEAFVLEELSPNFVSNIDVMKLNPYLNLNGNGVLIGIVDSGIDYLNKEFMQEDGTTRILTLWDQSDENNKSEDLYIGRSYTEADINNAIKLFNDGGDPYSIVSEKDNVGHGTKVAGIAGGRGYLENFSGIATNSKFAIVKLKQSAFFKNINKLNGVKDVPVYQSCDIFAAVNYISNFASEQNLPAVVILSLGSTVGSHDGNDIFSKYLNKISNRRPFIILTGVGNEGASEGHAQGKISSVGETKKIELVIPSILKVLKLKIWIKKPNKMSINIFSPSGEQSQFIKTRPNQSDEINYITEDTNLKVKFSFPDSITGGQVISLTWLDIKPGIWTLLLKGEYIVGGEFNTWLPPSSTLPPGTKFFNSTSDTTFTAPSSTPNIISVGYYNSLTSSTVSYSGKGFSIAHIIKPDIAAPGINILTTKVGGGLTTISGSSAALPIAAGVCALLLQWGVVDGNDIIMTPSKIRSYLITGAYRKNLVSYPNKEEGFGYLDLKGVFDIISGNF